MGEITLTEIDQLALHEELTIDDLTSVMCVPGGWIYCFWTTTARGADYIASSTFVPQR